MYIYGERAARGEEERGRERGEEEADRRLTDWCAGAGADGVLLGG